jgi:hypothetical protein
MEVPKSVEEVAALENCTSRLVEKWAAKNGVRKFGNAKRGPYVFYEEDIERFQNRDKKKGRRWPGKDTPISE